MNTWFVQYKCGRCGETDTITAEGQHKSFVVHGLGPRLHTCPRGRGENDPIHLIDTDRMQGVMLPISIWERGGK